MPIQFTCPHCGLETNVADEYAGRSGPCARCGKSITIPPLGAPFGYVPPPRPNTTGWIVLSAILIVGGLAVVFCAGILFWQTGAARAKRNQCANNLKQIGLAMHAYHDAHGCFPPAYLADDQGRPMHSWRVLLLPYLNQQALYNQYRFDEPWYGPNNRLLVDTIVPVYQCPDTNRMAGSAVTDYMMIVGPGTISDGRSASRMADVADGVSNTLMVVETAGSSVPWSKPQDLDANSIDFTLDNDLGEGIGSDHPDGPRGLFVDGSARTLPYNTPASDVKAMSTIAGGEIP